MDRLELPCAAVRALDRRAIEEYGISSLVLMENAARACSDEAQRMLAGGGGGVLVLCGPGNNGADGLVLARTLSNRGVETRVLFVGPRAQLEQGSADFRANLRLWRTLPGEARPVEVVAGATDCAVLQARLGSARLVVDALFGTGLARELGEPWWSAIQAVNASERAVLAVDVPSGLDADTGRVLGCALRADATVTFVARKPGFTRGRGPELCGRVLVAEIGIPRAWIEAAARGED